MANKRKQQNLQANLTALFEAFRQNQMPLQNQKSLADAPSWVPRGYTGDSYYYFTATIGDDSEFSLKAGKGQRVVCIAQRKGRNQSKLLYVRTVNGDDIFDHLIDSNAAVNQWTMPEVHG